ncbi:MAG: Asp-tRNA(Asn)/Glu-tRNA(Gln) amidotransferase subunit GatA [Candidatus Tritonobacter lacicola]|nr:Asp-tRNA(Asn)/Glu-tRNA(Gln) amidotransferase subunit GatA [Candidatus Tritonobacter lacicola]
MIRGKEVSARDAIESLLKRKENVDSKIDAYREEGVGSKSVLVDADNVDAAIRRGEDPGPLAGVPIARKANLCVKGKLTTCGSTILFPFRPPYDGTAIERLKEAGAILYGCTQMDEFAMGSSTENCGPCTKNPWDQSRVPGGSSGGSAAAVAADEAIAALGTDTGGSVRQPAAFCGVVGLKPTYGRVSRYGLIAFASSLDQIGPLTKDVEDAALLLSVIGGHDPRDSTSLDIDLPDFREGLDEPITGLRIGVPKEYFVEGLDGEVKGAVRKAIDELVALGAEVVDISLPHTEYAVATYYIIAPAEASSNLARYDGVQYGQRRDSGALLGMYEETRQDYFGDEVKRRIILGTYVLSSGYYDAYYLKAQKVRTLIKNDFDEAFKVCDVIVTPTSPTPAFKIGEKMEDPLQMYLSDIFTISANLAGIPAISIPCGFSGAGLPIGFQIMGRPLDERTVLQAAYAYEKSTTWNERRPDLKWITKSS